MTDYAKLFRDIEAQDNIRAATLAITPEGEIPTVNFEGAPETAKAVAHAVNPQQNAVQWDELGSVEKVLNSVEGGWHNRQKGLAAQAVVTAAREAEDGLASLVDPEDDEYRFLTENELTGLQDAVKNNSMSRAYKAEQNEAKTNAIYEYLDLSKQDKNYPMPDAVRSAAEKTEGKSFTEALPAYLKELGKDPIDSLTYMVGSSLGTIAPALITSVGAGAGLNLLRMNSTARAVQAALMGHGSYDAEVGGYINEYFQEKGYDLSNRETWEQALANEDLQELTEQAKRRGTVVGLFDAAGAFIAPVRLNPSNAFRTLRTAADGAQQVTQPASRMARIGKGVESLTLQTGIQSGLGMAGEALGQLVNNNPINWGDVFAEGIAEFGTGPFEVVSLSLSANANYRRETAIAQEAQRADKAWNDIATAVNTVAKQLPNDGSLEQWAQSVGKDANVFAFAQDFIENGELEKIRAVNPELAQRIEEAAGQKEDVTIPVADVLSIAAKDETVARSLLQDVRTTADGMSPRQAQDFLKNGKKEAVQAFDAILKRAKPDVELRREIQVETDKIEQELEQTGATKEVAQMQVLPWASWLAVRAKQTGLKPKAIMDTLRLRIRGEQTSTDGALNQSVSTALPSDAAVHPQGKNKKPLYPDPSYFHQWASFDEAKKNPNWLTTAVAKMRQIPGIKGATKGMRNADNMSEKIVERLTDNLVWLHNKVPEQLRQRAKLWYDGGRKAAETWAVRYGLRPRQTAAIIAIFSPQTDWFANMSMAERLLDIYFSARRQKADQAMLDWFNTEQGKKYNRADVEGKSLEELIQAKDFKKAAIWVRAYDKAHNPEARHALSPEGGTLDVVQNKSGKGPVKTSFMANKRIEDALSIIVDGSVDNVFKRIGSDFKVRNFYNNIFNPNNLNAVTIDTHAVGAGLFSVVSANDSVVADNFGNPGNATSGQNGTYPIYFEAYRRAAQKLGIQPREMQSITWEAIRALFDASAKTNLRPQVEAVWKRVDKGEITADQAREEIFDLAGGFSKTAWEDKDFNDKITQTYDRRHVKLYDDIVQPEPEPVLSMEVAPDPNDLEAVAQWNQLTDSEKLSVTQEVVPWIINRVAEETKTHIDEPSLQRGGYEGTPNYSMATTVEGGADFVRVARLLATYLRQESIMTISPKSGEGMFPGTLIQINLPEGYSTEQIDNLYNALDGIRDADGKRLIEGHSSVNGVMTIAVDASRIDEIKKKIVAVLQNFEPMEVCDSDSYIGFLTPYNTKEQENAGNLDGNSGAKGGIPQEASAQYNDNLRRETAEMVARKIRERLQARAEGGQARSGQSQQLKSQPLTQRDVARALEQLGYHGSPYQFDRFTLSHIGSGEGAQAHGWGLYFALNKQTAEGYRDTLSTGGRTTAYLNGKALADHEPLDGTVQERVEWSVGKTLKFLNSPLKNGSRYSDDKVREAIRQNIDVCESILKSWSSPDFARDFARDALTELKKMEANLDQYAYSSIYEKNGRVYTVEIPDDDVMLREDKRISEQSDFVQKAVKAAFKDLPSDYRKGEAVEFLEGLERTELGSMQNTMEKLWQMFDENDARIGDYKSLHEALNDAVHQDAIEIFKEDEEDNIENEVTVEEIEENCQDTLKEQLLGIVSEAWRIGARPNIDNYTGREVYSLLEDSFGSDKAASQLLLKHGIKGIRYDGRQDGECAVVWDEESIRILDALEQAKRSEGPRGTYMPQNTSDASSLSGVMTLMQTRDKSTFLHESAHAWLDADTMLAKGIAERVLKGEEINAGEMALLKNLGGFFRWGQEERTIDLGVTDDIKTVAQAVIRWSQMDISDQRMMHELFAEGFEAYLLEGTAPNTEMLTVFGKFKRWLMDIYARATRQPRPISREVRKLYDLMFATEQQAEDTQTRLGLKAMFEAADAKKLGMTDEEVQAYNDLQERAQLETEGLVAKAVHGVMRIFGKVRKEEIERIDKEALKRKEAELLEEPRYRAVALLNSRQVVLDASQMQGFDTDTVDALDAHGWISHNGGVSPAVLASMAGTTDTVGLIGDILEIDLVGDAHEEALRILAYENRKADGEEGVFSELHANLAAYNKTRSRLIAAEFNAIARMIGKQQILTSAAREYAIERIGEMRVSDIHPYVFINAEQRCAREAQEALKKGDYAACLEAKRGQVVNHEMARAALEAQERQVKAIRMVRRGLKSKTIHPKYQRLLKALIDAHAISSMTAAEREEFAKIPNLDAVQVSKLLKTLEDNGTPIDGLQEFLQTHEHVNDMTAYTAQDFFGVVKQVIAIGRNVLTQRLTDIAESVAEVVSEGKAKITEAADAQKRPVIEFPRMPITRKERALAKVSEFLLSHVKIQALCRILDRNKDGGFFWNLFIRSANERANFEAEERARCAQELKEKLLPVFKTSQDEDPIVVPGFDKPFTHGMRLAVALNLGNESNKQRLIMNEPRFTQEALQAIMDNLTEADWRAVEAIWQLFESFRPAIAAKQERVYGIEPEWITYTPFTVRTAEGKTITVSGGYYPVKYDPVASLRADKLTDAEAAEQEMKGAYQSATTRRSFTKSRFEGDIVGRPLRLDLSALYEGLNDVIHDLAWHEWLIDTKRVLDGVDGDTSGLRAAIKERYGYQITKELEEWRKDIALGGRSQGASDTLSFVTRNIGVATMGYSFMSAFVQLTGVGYVIPRTGTAAFAVALGKYLTNPAKVRRFVNSQSQAMLLRSQTQFKELAQIRNRLSQGKGVSAWMYDHAYSLLAFVQGIVDSLCWQAAYERFNREGHSGDELVALCDQVVIDTQSSGNVSDLSRIERERGLSQIFTIFYTWMNAALNLAITTQFGEENRFKRVATMLWICAVMPCIEQAYRESLKPSGDDDDDKDETLSALALGQLGNIVEYNMGLLTVAREFSSAVKGVVADDAVYNYSGPAGLRLLSNFNKGAQAIANPTEEKILKAVIDLSGSFLGLPSVQINNTIKGARAIESGQVEGVDAAKALVFGFKGKINE